jgi:hypothetical protein
MALQDGGTLSYFIRDVCVFFASFFLRKKMGVLFCLLFLKEVLVIEKQILIS